MPHAPLYGAPTPASQRLRRAQPPNAPVLVVVTVDKRWSVAALGGESEGIIWAACNYGTNKAPAVSVLERTKHLPRGVIRRLKEKTVTQYPELASFISRRHPKESTLAMHALKLLSEQ